MELEAFNLSSDQELLYYAIEHLRWDPEAETDSHSYFTVANLQLLLGDDAPRDQDLLDAVRCAVDGTLAV